jgi:mycothiol synthase
VANVSNFFAKSRQPATLREIECRLAFDADRHEGLRLLLSAGGRIADDGQIEHFKRFAAQRGMKLEHLWIACEGNRLAWTMLPIITPGRTALLFTPPEHFNPEAAERLIDVASRWGASQGVHLFQLLLDPGLAEARPVFERQQFRLMAELHYLQSPVRARETLPRLGLGMAWELYSEQSHPRFASAITASYRDSLDCPGLAGMRNIEDVIAGHKASGEFDPGYWFILVSHSRPLAVLLLNRVAGADAAELTYLGVAPEGRRMGLGTLLVRQALGAAAMMRVKSITLAVDAANAPALRLYFRHGFRKVASKLALMRDLRGC